MYVVTFYSFKGGVGRTFALVNVACALAEGGRTVLVVDFDLEAPGIQTFDLLKPESPRPGVVEYIYEFSRLGNAPDATQFVYEAKGVGRQGGSLWVMPAGKGDCDYRRKLASLHWQSLYKESDGYLMIEELKAQWNDAFRPDYVLIDSRTGHTDVEGICTRQLPDAVVLLFFPNEQNLLGLNEVVRDIRAEAGKARENAPALHFVMSNVPELDDEDGILRRRLRYFRTALGFRSYNTIHHYPSLSLLNQCVFVVERPKSRLTKEYLSLKDSIIEHNMEDRDAAIRFLRRGLGPYGIRFNMTKLDVETRIEEIRKFHPSDGEIQFLIAGIRGHQGRTDEARQLIENSVNSGYRSGAALLERAFTRLQCGERLAAIDDIWEALRRTDLDDFEAERATRLLGEADEGLLHKLPETPAIASIKRETRLSVASALMRFDKGLPVAAQLQSEVAASSAGSLRDTALNELALSMIGMGKFAEAMRTLELIIEGRGSTAISVAFNLAMAQWGDSGMPPFELFAHVAELYESPENRRRTANFSQCMAITFACLDRPVEARHCLNEAFERIKRGDIEFSCWRYRYVRPKDFLADCQSISKFIDGKKINPLFMLK